MLKHLLPAAAVALGLSGTAWAQAYDDEQNGAVFTSQKDEQRRADSLIGMTVLTSDGAEVGDVTDLILDQDDRIRGLVVSTGGWLGLGSKDVGVSWDQAEIRSDPETNGTVVVLNLMQAELEVAPQFKTQGDIKADQAAAGVKQQQLDQTPAAFGDATK